MEDDIYGKLNRIRINNSFLTLEETIKLAENGNTVFDPFSVLISQNATIGTGNIFYPGTVCSCAANGILSIGNGNIFMTGCTFSAMQGKITIGDNNYFGDGTVTVRTENPEAAVFIGSECRITGGAQIYGKTELGNGAQILGNIKVIDCKLSSGGSYKSSNPDLRGSVLKGCGTAKGIKLKQGQVISGSGIFKTEDVKMQSYFHPEQQKDKIYKA